MAEATYIEIPGTGRVRVATAKDVRVAIAAQVAERTPQLSLVRLARPGKREAITAAAQNAGRGDVSRLLRLEQPWQREAMRIYRTSGECWNPAQYYSRAMERIRYYPAIRDDRGVPVEVKSGPLVELFRRITSPSGSPGDLSELAGQYGRLQFVIGDGLLTVTDQDGEEIWEYLSPMELRLNPNIDKNAPQEYRRYRAPGVPPEELTEAPDNEFEATGIDQARIWRLWRRSPEFSGWADSPVRPIIDLYETLARLTLAVHAEASSRAGTRGMVYMPQEFSFGPVDQTQEENPEEDPLLREFQESFTRAIRDPGTAEAAQPYFLRGPGVTNVGGGSIPTADLIKWIALGPNDRYLEGEMWDKTISRIAGAIDMPKELLTGMGDLNHWTSFFLNDIGFDQHTQPTVIRFCNDIASAYLRPAARKQRIDNADQVTIWFDASQARLHPDATGVARDAYDRFAISWEYYRQQIGAPDSAAPTDEEIDKRIEIDIHRRALVSPEVADQPIGQTDQPGAKPPPGPPPAGDTTKRPPGNRPPSPSGPSMAAILLGAAEMQVVRAREFAGKGLWRRAQSCDECRDDTRDVKPALIAATLGPERVRSIIEGHTTEANLIEGTGDAFAELVRELGVNGGWPEQLGKMVEQHTLRTLYEPEVPRMPSGFFHACQRAADES